MKKTFMYFLVVAIMLSSTCISVKANAAIAEGEVTVFSDGSYCITTIEEESTDEFLRAAGTKTGTKTRHYYNTNNELQFSVQVRGTFTYNGTTAVATDSSYAYGITNTGWSFVSGHSYVADDSAVATCTFQLQNIENKTYSAILYCSPTGVLS